MANRIIDFSWRRNTAGYEWQDERVLKARVLVARHVPGARHEVYEPMQTRPALFRDFVDCTPTEDGFRGFADRWGPLGDISSPETDSVSVGHGEQYRVCIAGEMFQTWLEAHFHLKRAAALWDMLRREDRDALQRHVYWADDADDADDAGEKQSDGRENRRAVVYDSHPELQHRPERPRGRRPGDPLRRVEVIASRLVHPERLGVFSQPDIVWPARFYLCDLVTSWLQGRASLALGFDETWGFTRRLRPLSLLGCMWVMLLETVAFNKAQHQCPVCGEWFEVQRSARKDKAFCSNACRNRAYRERQETAASMAAAAVPVKEIAEQLGSDVPTVRGWIRASKKKEK